MIQKTIFLDEAHQVRLETYIIKAHPELIGMPKRPAVLIFPGGGYHMLSEREAQPIAFAFLKEGYQAFILRYTLEQSTMEKPLADATSALEMIKAQAEEWNVDKDKIAVAGFSAGGHLAATLATKGTTKPNALILGYPVISQAMVKLCGVDEVSLDTLVDHTTPPTFLFTTQNDNVVPSDDAFQFALSLQKAHVPMEFHFYQHGEHGISLATHATANNKQGFVSEHVATWLPLCLEWLQLHFGVFPTTQEEKDLHVEWHESTLSIHTALEVLLAHPKAKAMIAENFPLLLNDLIYPAIRGKNLYLMATMLQLDASALAQLDAQLKALS